MPANILGVNPGYDSSACLLQDGALIAAVEQERFAREKHVDSSVHDGLPYQAINYCLREADLRATQLDHAAIGWHPGLRLRQGLSFRLRQLARHPLSALSHSASCVEMYQRLKNAQHLLWRFGALDPSHVHCVPHHEAHAASSFFTSPFDKAALLVIDAYGEHAATSFGVGQGNRLVLNRSIDFPDSLGYVYAMVTNYLGFRPRSDEYRVMGLAAYGRSTFADVFRDMVVLMPAGGYRINRAYFDPRHTWPEVFSKRFCESLGPRRHQDDPVDERHANIAASLQRRLEETVLHMLEWLHRRTGETALCLSGGVALNCVMNGKIREHSPFERLHVQPAAGDAGSGLGAALMVAHHRLNLPRSTAMDHVLLGPSYGDTEIRSALSLSKWPFEQVETEAQLVRQVATLLAAGNTVGWFQGRMEWGPRALGNRSILADPTRPEMKDTINQQIKQREDFRPFAPSCTEESAMHFFDMDGRSPFMTLTCRVKPACRARLPATTHVDGTARLHTVDEHANPRFYRLLEAFQRHTGVPILLNTSFNTNREPIVCTPADAIRCFSASGIDALAIGNFLLTKSGRTA